MKRSHGHNPRPLRFETLDSRQMFTAGPIAAAASTAASIYDPAPLPGQVEQQFAPTAFPIGEVSSAKSIALAGGKILSAGAYNGQLEMVRYNANGTLDTTFGTAGIMTLQIAKSAYGILQIQVEANGSIDVLGSDSDPVAGGNGYAPLQLNHFSANGAPVGAVVTFGGFGNAQFVAALLQPDGKVVVATNASLYRFNADGSADSSFNGTGQAPLELGSTSWTDQLQDYYGYELAIDSGGRLIVAAEHAVYGSISTDVVARYNANGTLDQSFGNAGLVTLSFGDDQLTMQALAIDSQDRIVLAGAFQGNEPSLASSPLTLVRLTSGGQLDTTFGVGGKASLEGTPVNLGVEGILIQADGKLVIDAHYQPAVGSAPPPGSLLNIVSSVPTGPPELLLARFNSDGSIDTAFGSDGVAVATAPYAIWTGSGLAQQTDGKLIATNATYSSQNGGELFTSRFDANGSLDTTFGGVWTLPPTETQTVPVTQGTPTTNPIATNPIATNPIATNPIATNPIVTGPITTGPTTTVGNQIVTANHPVATVTPRPATVKSTATATAPTNPLLAAVNRTVGPTVAAALPPANVAMASGANSSPSTPAQISPQTNFAFMGPVRILLHARPKTVDSSNDDA